MKSGLLVRCPCCGNEYSSDESPELFKTTENSSRHNHTSLLRDVLDVLQSSPKGLRTDTLCKRIQKALQ